MEGELDTLLKRPDKPNQQGFARYAVLDFAKAVQISLGLDGLNKIAYLKRLFSEIEFSVE
jgi:hypothetical protein